MKKTSTMLVGSLIGLAASSALAGDILVYSGEGALNQGYVKFGNAAGKTVQTLGVLPADLSPFDCTILPVNGANAPAFSAATLAALNSYVNGGGRIIAEADHSGFPGPILAMNDLAATLGADLVVLPDLIDCGFNTTNNIDPSPFTVGVNSITFGCTSQVGIGVGPNAHSLVRTTGGTTFVGIDKIGSGVFVLAGDSNLFSDNSGDGYTVQDNGTLAANICDQVRFEIDVILDIKPGSEAPSPVNPGAKGVIPVAILTTPEFDATQVDDSTLAFGPSGAAIAHEQSHVEDVDGDGDDDLVVHFRTQDTGIACGDTEATLTGETLFDGIPISGTDSIHTVGKSCK